MASTKFCDLQPFLDHLTEQVENRAPYIWSGQGQILGELDINEIFGMVDTRKNTSTVFAHLAELAADAKFNPSVTQVFDCSGLESYWLYNKAKVLAWDHNADAFMKECVIIDGKYRQPGDFVFRSITDKGVAKHMGTVVADKTVTEARGSAYGVVNRAYADGKWQKVGRPPYFAYIMTRSLSKGCIGDDVGQLQARLTYFGFPCGSVDNDFGAKTQSAVKAFQKNNKLTSNGVVDEKTALKLGFKYNVKTS